MLMLRGWIIFYGETKLCCKIYVPDYIFLRITTQSKLTNILIPKE